jgi:hypothetical protein
MHGIAFLLIITTGVLAPLMIALVVRGNAGWRLIGVIPVAASAPFVVFLFLPCGNASFLIAVVTLFAWIAAIAVGLATLNTHSEINREHSLLAFALPGTD